MSMTSQERSCDGRSCIGCCCVDDDVIVVDCGNSGDSLNLGSYLTFKYAISKAV